LSNSSGIKTELKNILSNTFFMTKFNDSATRAINKTTSFQFSESLNNYHTM